MSWSWSEGRNELRLCTKVMYWNLPTRVRMLIFRALSFITYSSMSTYQVFGTMYERQMYERC
jgi:hypothetical protein